MKPSAFYRGYLRFLTLIWQCRDHQRKASDHQRCNQKTREASHRQSLLTTREHIARARSLLCACLHP